MVIYTAPHNIIFEPQTVDSSHAYKTTNVLTAFRDVQTEMYNTEQSP